MRFATLRRRLRPARPGLRASVALGLLAAALAGLAWVAWRGSVDPWPARATLGTSRSWPLGFSPDGRTFYAVADGVVTPWDVASGREGSPWAEKVIGSVMASAFSPDGRTFAVTIAGPLSDPAKVDLLDAADGRRRATIEADHPVVYRLDWPGDGGSIRAFLGDNARLKEVATYDPATGRKAPGRPISAPMRADLAGISPDGSILALYTPNGQGVDLWDLEGNRFLGRLANPAAVGPISRAWAGFSADGGTIAIGRLDGSVELRDVPGRTLLKSIPVHPRGYAPATIRIAPDGRTFASAAWESPDNSTFGRFRGDARRSVLGPDRHADSEVAIVDLATGRALARARSSTQPIYSPDGKTIATRDDGGVRLRVVPPSPR